MGEAHATSSAERVEFVIISPTFKTKRGHVRIRHYSETEEEEYAQTLGRTAFDAGVGRASVSGQSQVVKGTPNPGTKAKVAPSNTTGQAATQSSAANGNLKLKQQTLRQQNRPVKTTGSLTPPPPGQAALTPPPPGQAGHNAVTKGKSNTAVTKGNGTAVTKGNGNTAVTKGSGSAAVTKGGNAAITKGNAAVTKGAQSSAVTKGSAASKTAVTKGQTGSPQR